MALNIFVRKASAEHIVTKVRRKSSSLLINTFGVKQLYTIKVSVFRRRHVVDVPLVAEFLVALAQNRAADVRLEERDDAREPLVTPVLQRTQHADLEEDLGVAQAVVVLLQCQRAQHLLGRHLAVDEALRDDVRRQDRVAKTERSYVRTWL